MCCWIITKHVRYVKMHDCVLYMALDLTSAAFYIRHSISLRSCDETQKGTWRLAASGFPLLTGTVHTNI
jgi:hypothetical protein